MTPYIPRRAEVILALTLLLLCWLYTVFPLNWE